jgi:hypothetical protein
VEVNVPVFGPSKTKLGKPSKPRFRRRLGQAGKSSYGGQKPKTYHPSPVKTSGGDAMAFPNKKGKAFKGDDFAGF